MGTLTNIYRSSVGKKFVVALTGLFLCTFLVEHLAGNFLLFVNDGGASFNEYSETLSHNVIIRTIEIVLFLAFFFHILTATTLWWRNRKARPDSYAQNQKSANSTLASRISFLTGSIVFIFLVIHLRTFFVPSRFFPSENPSMYTLVVFAFSNGWYCLFYLVALVLLGYHLRHGFQSAFQTFGIRGKNYQSLIEWIGVIFWLLIPLGFATMPIYFFWTTHFGG
ncbi:MAG: succinate dehydrogenase cytochrome b subunit [Bacteroidota bacterium]|nr:succinate dehydrogenase cytochrome b subunit [Bacteroidota bacterium]